MDTSQKRNTSATGEIKFTGIRTTAPATHAAGVEGIKAAMAHAFKEMGVARSFSALAQMNQTEGFDCPGCAWPDPEKPSKLGEFCENGAKALAEEATHLTLDRHFFAQHSVEALSQWSDYRIGKSGRLVEPMVLRPGAVHYSPISWQEAFELIAGHLRQLDTPHQAMFYTSGRSSNEAAFLYGLFVRAFGTNNMPDCSNMCHESSGVGLSETLGIGKGSVTLEDFNKAQVIMILGQNPGTNHPRMLSALQKCKDNGGKIITVNPLEEAGLVRFKNPQQLKGITKGTVLTDLFLPVKINADVALMKLLIKRLAQRDQAGEAVFDHAFIQTHTEGYEALMADLETYSEAALLKACGVASDQVDAAVELLAKNERIIICWAMGLTQHKNGVDNIKELVNLLLLKGSLGKEGAGTCPVRGHSNVQGDRTVGIMHYVSPTLNASIKKVFGFDAPTETGLDTVHGLEAMHSGAVKVFMALGGNFVSAVSDTHYAAAAMNQCELTVQVSTKLNRSHLITGKTALILPTLGRSEQDIKDGKARFLTVENSMGKVHRTKGVLPPKAHGLKSEPEIVAGVASAYFGEGHPVPWASLGNDYALIRKKLGEVIASFRDLEERSKGTGYYLPNNVRQLDFSKLPNGRARFSLCPPAEHQMEPDDFLLMTIRSHDQFNTTIYGLNDRYRGVYNERRVLFMHPEDMKERGFAEREVVDLSSHYDGKERRAEQFLVLPYAIPRGNLAAYFPETNVLVPHNHYAKKSHTPISKSVIVKVKGRSGQSLVGSG
ncbi:FdhF/YdeP family oxidoreductase [Maribacter sp. 2307ULW6-5]|uniref:FdhF/YdeP family oxidoreductase n=1 Tax=Maribacter sp. 2307ULW6-5 TaxID=3386275 RepID=UPI0039BCC4AB